jgi:hypothetical protein
MTVRQARPLQTQLLSMTDPARAYANFFATRLNRKDTTAREWEK